jgi:hypothetical protein
MAKKQKLDLEKLAKKAEKEAKDLLEKDSFSAIAAITESVGEVPLGSFITTTGTTISVDSSVIVKDDPMYEMIKRIVKEVLFEEKVLISISGKVKEYNPTSIAISKLDQDVKKVVIESEPDPVNILEELEKIR